MKTKIILWAIGGAAVGAGWYWSQTFSNDVVVAALFLVLGILAGIPTALVAISLRRRDDYWRDDCRPRQTPQERPQAPQQLETHHHTHYHVHAPLSREKPPFKQINTWKELSDNEW